MASPCHPWFTTTNPSPIGFLFLKLPPPPCAVLLVGRCNIYRKTCFDTSPDEPFGDVSILLRSLIAITWRSWRFKMQQTYGDVVGIDSYLGFSDFPIPDYHHSNTWYRHVYTMSRTGARQERPRERGSIRSLQCGSTEARWVGALCIWQVEG